MACAFCPPMVLGPNHLRRSVSIDVLRKFVSHSRKSSHRHTRMQTWSDPAVTNEYFDYLQNGTTPVAMSQDCRSTIVGSGRIGSLIEELGKGDDVVLSRGDSIPKDTRGPIYLCVRNDDLAGIIDACPEDRKEDLVFMQNGMLEDFWKRHGVLTGPGTPAESSATRVNLWFGIAKKGGDVIGKRSGDDSDQLTCATGKWAGAVKERLEKGDLGCRLLGERDWRRNMLEKLVWIAAFNLVGAVHGNLSMGEVATAHETEVSDMVSELCTMLRFTLAVAMMSGTEQRLIQYAKSVADFPTGLKEFMWRNGWFYGKSRLALANNFSDPSPIHTNYLEDGKKRGLIDWKYEGEN